MSTDTSTMTEAELAEYYSTTRDLSEFDEGEDVEVMTAEQAGRLRGTRSSTLSVRFHPEEIELLADRAREQGTTVSGLVRAAALAQVAPVDRDAVRKTTEAIFFDVLALARLMEAQPPTTLDLTWLNAEGVVLNLAQGKVRITTDTSESEDREQLSRQQHRRSARGR